MDLYPSIDILDGRVVRLAQGDYERETSYGDDPLAVAHDFALQGAPWIHVVDLNAAKGDGPVNAELVHAIAAAVDVPVQAGGGQVDDSALKAGVQRVVLGSLAVSQPDVVDRLAAQWPGRVAVGLDNRKGKIAVRGWLEDSGQTVDELIARFEASGVAAFVITDIGRDGLLTGPDTEGLAVALGRTDVPVIASGGVSSLADLRVLAAMQVNGRRLVGAITGRAIYEGHFTVEEGVAACASSA